MLGVPRQHRPPGRLSGATYLQRPGPLCRPHRPRTYFFHYISRFFSLLLRDLLQLNSVREIATER